MVGVREIKCNEDEVKTEGSKNGIHDSSPKWINLVNLVESCMVRGLAKAYDEYTEPLETYYKLFSKDIESNLKDLSSALISLNNTDLTQPSNSEFVSAMFLLTEEMKSEGPWCDESYSKYANILVDWFNTNCSFFFTQEPHMRAYRDNIFQMCMCKIHSKLTKDKWKHHPAAFNCYRNLIKSLSKMGTITCPLALAFPGTLLQIDDYHDENKLEGLKCCSSLLRQLVYFETGYEEVVYETLYHLLKYREQPIVDAALDSLIIILPMFSVQICRGNWTKSDDVFELILENLYLESDMNRKIMYFHYLPTIIEISGNSAIRWKKKIMNLICDNMDIYLNDSSDVRTINKCLKCLNAWVAIGWPVWNSNTDQDVLTRLYKLVYILSEASLPSQDTKDCLIDVENSIQFIFQLFTEEERLELLNDKNDNISKLGKKFTSRWTYLKLKILGLSTKPEEDAENQKQ